MVGLVLEAVTNGVGLSHSVYTASLPGGQGGGVKNFRGVSTTAQNIEDTSRV